MQRSTDDKEGKAFVGRLTDEAAITRASNLVSEITLFGIATGLLVFEMNQASRTNEEKAQKAREEREELDRRLTNQERLLIELLAAARCEAATGWTVADDGLRDVGVSGDGRPIPLECAGTRRSGCSA